MQDSLGSYLHRVYSDFGVVLLSLELQLHIQQSDLGRLILLGLHFEPGIRERLLKGNSGYQLRVLEDRICVTILPRNVPQQGNSSPRRLPAFRALI